MRVIPAILTERRKASWPMATNRRAAEVVTVKAKGRAIARELKMPPSSLHKALSMAV